MPVQTRFDAILNQNVLLMTDIYKTGHMLGYKPGMTKCYSYLCARSLRKSKDIVFFGSQYYMKILEAFAPTREDAEEFFEMYTEILGGVVPTSIQEKINALVDLGYIPLEIKAVPEGTVIDNQNVLMTVTNTLPEFAWVVGFFESLLLKIWNTSSVATLSHKFKKTVIKFMRETAPNNEFLVPYLIHDFGYRGVSSEETSALSGAAHLVNFRGTDTVPAVRMLKRLYGGVPGQIGSSVYATEHSLHCSFGPTEQDEYDYVDHQLTIKPEGICSIVCDAYDYWRMLTVTIPKFKDRILARNGKVVLRGDSGIPDDIICGNITSKPVKDLYAALSFFQEVYLKEGGIDPQYVEFGGNTYILYAKDTCDGEDIGFFYELVNLTPANKGTLVLLQELFGYTVNEKGYKELNPKVGTIYGDGMYFDRYQNILNRMKTMKIASTDLVAGIGGLLLQQHSRDDHGFAFKATFAIINDEVIELFKDPITDTGKRSHKGLMHLKKEEDKFITLDQVSEEMEQTGELRQIFFNGKITKLENLEDIRARALSRLEG